MRIEKSLNHARLDHSSVSRALLLLLAATALCACSESGDDTAAAPAEPGEVSTTGDAVNAMLDSLGGLEALRGVDNLVLRGSGSRRHLGQIPETGGEDPVGELPMLTEIIDLENGRAAFDNDVLIGGGFQQHRTEVLTVHQGEPLSWGTTEGRPNQVTSVDGIFSWATHNSPEWLLRRNLVSVALAAADLAGSTMPARTGELQGAEHWQLEVDMNGEELSLFVDQDSFLPAAWRALDTETMRGDTMATYLLDDYRPVQGLMLPFSLEIVKEDGVYASIQYDSITINDEDALAIFDIPEDVIDQADQVIAAEGSWVPLTWNPVTDTVTHVVAFSHHSMVVEFPDFVAVVEAPYSEGQSLSMARLIEENIGKPIRYVAPTHPHYDHTGGVRALASLGASVLVAAGHEDELRMIVESPHTNPPDALARRIAEGGEVGQVEVYEGMTEVSEGGQTLQLFEVDSIPHVKPMVLAYVPEGGVLFQSDLFFGGPGPDAEALYMAIEELGLDVQQIVGGHGGVLPFTMLEEAVGGGQ